jgi:hypothetical protein
MRILGVIGTAVLFLLLVTTAPVFAQDEAKPDEAKPAHKQDEKAKPEDKAKHEDKAAKPDDRKGDREQPGARQDEHRGQPEARSQSEQRPEGSMDRDQQQHRAHAQGGKHIPDDKFRSSFGRQHTFKVQRTQIVNSPQPVVVYGGYSFQLVDAWPAEWAFDDDCYIEYVDGQYFLFDAFHPEVRVAVFVVE